MRRWFVLPLLAVCMVSAEAHAQTDAKARAEALFEEGRALMKKGDLAAACPKLAASQKLDPGVGTLLNLATCYEKAGKTASAWESFHEAEASARREGQDDRVRFAHEHVTALASKLPHLIVRVPSATTGEVVRLDGTVLDPSAWGDSLPVDPGSHRVEASAEGKQSWSGAADVTAGKPVEIAVPALADAAPSSVPATTTPVATTPVATTPAAPAAIPATHGTSALFPVGIAVGVVGLAGVALGVGFGVDAKNKNDAALTHCPQTPACADQTGVDLTHEAQTSATVSTVGFIAGGVLVAAAVTMVLIAPREKRAVTARLAPVVGPGTFGAALGGTF